VSRIADPQDTLLVMCRSGGRSATAVNLLASAGFRNVYNMTARFYGPELALFDQSGQLLVLERMAIYFFRRRPGRTRRRAGAAS
jgi:hypothetical protein